MSFSDETIFENALKMPPEKGSEILLSIILSSADWKIRAKAAEYLREFKDSNHLNEMKSVYQNESYSQSKAALIKLLANNYGKEGIEFIKTQYKGEKDWAIRKLIIENVEKVELLDSIPFLIDALSDNNIEVKRLAIILLGKSTSSKGVKSLIDLLQYGNREVYSELLDALVRIGKFGNLAKIIEFTEKGNIYVKRALPLILGKIEDKSTVDILINLLNHEDPEVRTNAIKALTSVIQLKDIRNIIQRIYDEDLDVRKAAIKALGVVKSKRAINPLLEMLKEKDSKTRHLVIKTLLKLFKKYEFYDELYLTLTKRNINSRIGVVKLLGLVGDQHALDDLLNILNSKNTKLRQAAYKTIVKIIHTTKTINPSIIDAMSSKEWQIRKYIAKILGDIQDDKNISDLFKLLTDPKSGVRKAAVQALAKYDHPSIIQTTTNLLKNDDWRTRRAAVRLLTEIGTNEALEPLLTSVNDEDVFIKTWAITALGKFKNLKNIEPFLKILKSNDPKLKISAIKALGEIGDKGAIKPLVNFLGDVDWDVRMEIEKSLKKLDPNWMSYI